MTPNDLLARMRAHTAYLRREAESDSGITDSPHGYEEAVEIMEELDRLGKSGRLPDEWGPPVPEGGPEAARKILADGLKYHEHDGHSMPKRVARDALAALGVPEEERP